MRLQAWDIEVAREPVDDEVSAVLQIAPNPLRHYAAVSIGAFFAKTAEEQRYSVAHELMHLISADLWKWAHRDGGWKDLLAPDHAAAIEEMVRNESEKQADFIGRLLAPLLPMPPEWPR